MSEEELANIMASDSMQDIVVRIAQLSGETPHWAQHLVKNAIRQCVADRGFSVGDIVRPHGLDQTQWEVVKVRPEYQDWVAISIQQDPRCTRIINPGNWVKE